LTDQTSFLRTHPPHHPLHLRPQRSFCSRGRWSLTSSSLTRPCCPAWSACCATCTHTGCP